MQCCNNGIPFVHELSGMMDVYMLWCEIIMPQLLRNLTKHITRAVAIACTDDLLGLYLVDLTFLCCHSSLYLEGNQLQQLPAGVFSSLTSLRSLTYVVVCMENVCVQCLCMTSERMIVSFKQSYILEEG